MKAIFSAVRRFAIDATGSTAVEYAFLGSLVALGFVTFAVSIGDLLSGLFNVVAGHF